jgi:hypothetical protein
VDGPAVIYHMQGISADVTKYLQYCSCVEDGVIKSPRPVQIVVSLTIKQYTHLAHSRGQMPYAAPDGFFVLISETLQNYKK